MSSRSKLLAELETLGIHLRRSQGQHFLLDDNIAKKQVNIASPTRTDTVLEVGPGLGVLTKVLAGSARKVITIEKDKRLAAHLSRELPENVEVIQGDAMEVSFPSFDLFVANIPYQISSPLIFKLLEHDFKMAVIMLQDEFAQRLVATPGTKSYSRITIGVSLRCQCEIVHKVSPEMFFPRPKVNSAIVKLTPRPQPIKTIDDGLFNTTVKAAFSHRRKKIQNTLLLERKMLAVALKGIPNVELESDNMTKDGFSQCLSNAPHSQSRAEQLDLEDFNELVDHIARWFISD